MTNFPPASTESLTPLPTLLIIEDSEVDRHTYQRYLATEKEYRYQIIEAATWGEGLAYWHSVCPDLIILDVNLADGNGLEFLATLKETGLESPLPVIVITGLKGRDITLQAMKLGVRDYLNKEKMTASGLCRSVKSALKEILAARNLARLRQQEMILAKIGLKISQLTQLEAIYQLVVTEIRSFLHSDRVMIYQFAPDWSGIIIAEAVVSPWPPCIPTQVFDTYFQENKATAYEQDQFFAVADIYNANLSDCHVELLERFQVRANLVVPILLPAKSQATTVLWGLLIAHQCDRPRNWEETDIHFLQRVAVQLAIAVQQHQANQQIQAQIQELSQWRKRYELAERASGQMVYEYDFLTDSVIWAANAELVLGYSSLTIPQGMEEWVALIHPEDRSRFLTEVVQTQTEKRDFAAQYRFRHQQGHYIWLEDRHQLLPNQQGEKVSVIGMIADITQRKQTEVQLITNGAS